MSPAKSAPVPAVLKTPISGSHLFYGDNLVIMRAHLPDECVDLVYLDPPFNSEANYNVLFKSPSGARSPAQIEAFEDTWDWETSAAEEAFDEVMQSGNTDAAQMLKAIRGFLGENAMMAYLCMMAIRMLELRRVMKPTASIYLHCDPTASHYLKILMDAVFGAKNFRNEIIWQRTTAHSSAKRFSPIHDTVLYYRKGATQHWNAPRLDYDNAYLDKYYKFDDGDGRLYWKADITGAGIRTGDSGKPWRGHDPTHINRHWAIPKEVISAAVGAEAAATMSAQEKLDVLDGLNAVYFPKGDGMPQYKRYREQLKGKSIGDIWTDIDRINPVAGERLGYPTQKPVTLLERILTASSSPGDVILDPFCGCGTSIHAAQKLGRKWIGIDVTHLAVSHISKRIEAAFPGVSYAIHGTPQDADGARTLAAADKHQFQLWAVSQVDGGQPYKGGKKGADSGIDGLVFFKPDGKATEQAIISVKGGENVGVAVVRDLAHVVDREKARLGILVMLGKPTGPMKTEAIKAGFYDSPHHGKIPKIQILTVPDIFDGRKVIIPLVDKSAVKKAAKEDTGKIGQKSLF